VHFRNEPFIVELTGKNNRSFVFANTGGLGGGHSAATTRFRCS
jgi:hypothetical protein